MGQQIIKQPDGNYAIWSTVSDGFIMTDATRQDVIDFRVEEATKSATRQAEEVIDQIESGGNPYFQFKMEWNEAADDHNRNFPDSPISKTNSSDR